MERQKSEEQRLRALVEGAEFTPSDVIQANPAGSLTRGLNG